MRCAAHVGRSGQQSVSGHRVSVGQFGNPSSGVVNPTRVPPVRKCQSTASNSDNVRRLCAILGRWRPSRLGHTRVALQSRPRYPELTSESGPPPADSARAASDSGGEKVRLGNFGADSASVHQRRLRCPSLPQHPSSRASAVSSAEPVPAGLPRCSRARLQICAFGSRRLQTERPARASSALKAPRPTPRTARRERAPGR